MRAFFGPMAAVSLLCAACGHANIEANCGTNGLGDGRCDFTNDGTAVGTMCAKIRVTDTRGLGPPVTSDMVCSGDVRPRETKSASFNLNEVASLCRPSAEEAAEGGGKPWDKYCTVETIPYREKL